jgi:alkyl hydroperoxide reductase subunit AhpC
MSGDGEQVSLSRVLAEKVAVLVFYIFDFSGG